MDRSTTREMAFPSPIMRDVPGATLMLHSFKQTPGTTYHTHTMPLASFMLGGACTEYDEKGRKRLLETNGVHMTPVDMRHAHSQISPLARTVCVAFGPELVKLGSEYGGVFDRPILRHSYPLATLGRRLAEEIDATDVSSNLVIQGLLIELVGTLGRNVEREEREAPSWLQQAAELLCETESDYIGVLEVADRVAVHPSHLIRAFRTHYGTTPGNYARRARLERCRREVQQGELPLKAIAAKAGFADPAHFSREFRLAFGTTPSAYRRGS